MTTHSSYGGSSIYILDKCPGALRLYPDAPPDESSPQAEEGTAAHHLGEFCLKSGLSAYDCLGLEFNKYAVSGAMANDVQLYISEVRRILAENPDARLLIEPKVTMSSVSGEVYGFIDAMIFIPSKRKLIIGDLKYGYGLVESSTMQIKHYSVSALDTYQLWGLVDTIDGFICQPRGEHTDGETRYIHYTIHESLQHQARFRQIYHETKKPDAPLVPGEHCHYCKASAICRPRLERTLNMLYPDAPFDTLAKGEVMEMYKELAVMSRQIKKLEALANDYARAGAKLDGYKVVKSIARHDCTDEEGLVNAILTSPASSIKDRTELYNMRLKGKTALMDTPGVPRSVVSKFFKAPDNVGVELVKVNDRRPAVGIGAGLGRFEPISGKQISHNFTPV